MLQGRAWQIGIQAHPIVEGAVMRWLSPQAPFLMLVLAPDPRQHQPQEVEACGSLG